jgi:hypothetical protein
MVKTVIALALTLASTEVEEDLFIKSAGLWRFYHSQRKLAQIQSRQVSSSGSTSVEGVYSSFWDWSSSAAVGSGWNKQFGEYVMLFYGDQGHDLVSTRNATAVSSGGICIYSKVLDPSTFATLDLEKASLVYICAGSIEHEGKPYSLIKDDNDRSSDANRPAYGAVDPYRASWRHSKIQGTVRETTQGLNVSYQMVLDGVTSEENITIWPAQLAEDIAFSRGWVDCNTSGCQKIMDFGCSVQVDGSGIFEILGVKFCVISNDCLGKCAAIAVAFHSRGRDRVLMREGACLQCCIRTALRGDTNSNYRNTNHTGDQGSVTWYRRSVRR